MVKVGAALDSLPHMAEGGKSGSAGGSLILRSVVSGLYIHSGIHKYMYTVSSLDTYILFIVGCA